MRENDTNRNIIGGVCGGFLGLFLFGWASPSALSYFLLPLGCLIGVVGGYWHDHIWAAIRTNWKKLQSVNFHIPELPNPRAWFAQTDFSQWLSEHPMNRAGLYRAMAAFVFVAIGAVTTYWLIFSVIGAGSETVRFWQVGVSIALFLSWVIFTLFTLIVDYLSSPDLKYTYRRCQAYYNHGGLYFFVYSLLSFTIHVIPTTYILLMAATYVVVKGVVISFLASTVSAGRVIFHLTLRANHWICFAVTLFITFATAWITGNYLENSLVLWAVSLLNGGLCGFLAKLVANLVAKSLSQATKLASWLDQPFKKTRDSVVQRWKEWIGGWTDRGMDRDWLRILPTT